MKHKEVFFHSKVFTPSLHGKRWIFLVLFVLFLPITTWKGTHVLTHFLSYPSSRNIVGKDSDFKESDPDKGNQKMDWLEGFVESYTDENLL